MMLLTNFSSEIQNQIILRFGENPNCKFLQEEASTRRYFLISNETAKEVLCTDSSINTDFIQLSKFLSDNHIPVPKVISIENSTNCIFQSFEGIQDFSSLDVEEYKKQLPAVLEWLLEFQKLDPPILVKERRFDFEKLNWEIQLTITKFAEFQNRFRGKANLTVEAIAFLEETCRYLDAYPIQVFTHRDFHSRNILLKEGGGYSFIDFQDARMGTPQYDLASILYDSYYPLPRQFRMEMLQWFQNKSLGKSNQFKECYYLQALQRSFKAMGTYLRLILDQDKEKFKKSLVNCLVQIEEIIQLGMFADSLYVFVKEFQQDLKKLPEFSSV